MIINLKSENELSGFYIVYEGSTNLENKGNFFEGRVGSYQKSGVMDSTKDGTSGGKEFTIDADF